MILESETSSNPEQQGHRTRWSWSFVATAGCVTVMCFQSVLLMNLQIQLLRTQHETEAARQLANAALAKADANQLALATFKNDQVTMIAETGVGKVEFLVPTDQMYRADFRDNF